MECWFDRVRTLGATRPDGPIKNRSAGCERLLKKIDLDVKSGADPRSAADPGSAYRRVAELILLVESAIRGSRADRGSAPRSAHNTKRIVIQMRNGSSISFNSRIFGGGNGF